MNQVIELLDKKHKKKEFNCGKQLLDNYLKNQASQDIRKQLSVCFVLEDAETGLIQGYYTLANNSIPQNNIPENLQKKLPNSYTSIPVTLLGRLAIDQRFQGKGVGKILLIDALKRSCQVSKSIGSFAVIVDPLDDEAEKFYEKFDFIKLPDSGKMFIAMQTLKLLFEAEV